MAAAASAAAAVVRLGRRVVAAGLVVGAGGNASMRTGPDRILVTPSAVPLDEVGASDLVALGLDGLGAHHGLGGHHRLGGPVAAGAVRAGGGAARRPSSESPMHLAAHRARPDAAVVLHVHPPHANLLVATGHQVRLITTDHAYYVRRTATVPYLPSGTEELADAVAALLAEVDVVLLASHGALVVAPDAEVAYERAANLEAAATATYRALLLGDTTTACPPEYLARVEALEAEAGGPVYGR
ncbi:MAG: class II aldolase/adducin family protein [Acidimicrobiales bacterium]